LGDNINCFNLNTSSQPQLLAVDTTTLASKNAFHVKVDANKGNGPVPHSTESGWNALAASPRGEEVLPAFVDETTLKWALKRKVGDRLNYTDENGLEFEVQIVGTLPDSILQGYLVVDERAFLEKFPSHPGYSRFLIEVTANGVVDTLRGRLEAALRDVGGNVMLTRDVLAAFHQIENTYIAIFNVLGSLGVVLGSLGLAIVVARNLRERRGEFAAMTAMGIPREVLARMIFSEFGRMVLWGISIGIVAAAIAVWPNITALPAWETLLLVGVLLNGIVVLNLVSGWAIFRWSTRDLRGNIAATGL
jgi:ABC-type antimicrobial peptide transport system permease subunit